MNRIVLASSSPYRRQLLARVLSDFSVVAPQVDEQPRPAERPEALAARLAEEKACEVARRSRDALVIGSDQVAVLDDAILSKPGDAATNRAQLARASGRCVNFFTGVSLVHADSGRTQVDCVAFTVWFRHLSDAQIDAYVAREQAFDCAGGFRCEGLGIALFERLQGEDPSALIGLPLLRLVQMLAREGVDVLLQGRPAEP